MCLGIPGRVVETFQEHDMLMGKVDFGGVFKQVCLQLTPDVQIDQYVIVHVGFALQIIDEDEAQQIFSFLECMDDLDALDAKGSEVASSDRDFNVDSAS